MTPATDVNKLPGRAITFRPSLVLLATDFSPSAAGALEVALVVARQFGAALSILHVHAPQPASVVGTRVDIPAPATTMPTSAEQLGAIHEHLAEILARCREWAVAAHAEVVPLKGRVAEVISDQTARQGADLVVMGTHGRAGLGRAVLGSVAEGVMRSAEVPVLTVRLGEAPQN